MLMTNKKIRVHVFISGHVQGIGFRASAQRKAYQLGLAGWVKNLADGGVEAVFEGREEAVEEMVQWCHQGPFLAEVFEVEIKREPLENLFGFEIRY